MAAETLVGIFHDAVATYRNPSQFMRKNASGWQSISAETALADVASLFSALRDLGVAKGDRVALLSENRYEWPVTDLAILGTGAVTVPIYPTLTAQQVRFIVQDSGAKLIVVSTPAQLDKMIEINATRADFREASRPRSPRRVHPYGVDGDPAGAYGGWRG